MSDFKVVTINPIEGKDNIVSIQVTRELFNAVVPKDFVKIGDSVDFIKAGQVVDATHPRFNFLKSDKIQYNIESRIYGNSTIVDGVVLHKLPEKSDTMYVAKIVRIRSTHSYDSTLKSFSKVIPFQVLPYGLLDLEEGYVVYYTFQKIAKRLNPSFYIFDVYKKGKKMSRDEIKKLELKYPHILDAVENLNPK